MKKRVRPWLASCLLLALLALAACGGAEQTGGDGIFPAKSGSSAIFASGATESSLPEEKDREAVDTVSLYNRTVTPLGAMDFPQRYEDSILEYWIRKFYFDTNRGVFMVCDAANNWRELNLSDYLEGEAGEHKLSHAWDTSSYYYFSKGKLAFFYPCYCGRAPVLLVAVVNAATGEMEKVWISGGTEIEALESVRRDDPKLDARTSQVYLCATTQTGASTQPSRLFSLEMYDLDTLEMHSYGGGSFADYGFRRIEHISKITSGLVRMAGEDMDGHYLGWEMRTDHIPRTSFREGDLWGVWHNGEPERGLMPNSRYIFFEDGRFAYGAPTDDPRSEIMYKGGIWDIRENELHLTVMEKVIPTGGSSTFPESLSQADSWNCSGRLVELEAGEYEHETLYIRDDALISSDAFYSRGSDILRLGGREYSKLREHRNLQWSLQSFSSLFPEYAECSALIPVQRPVSLSEALASTDIPIIPSYAMGWVPVGTEHRWFGLIQGKLGRGGLSPDGIAYINSDFDPEVDYYMNFLSYQEEEYPGGVVVSIPFANCPADVPTYIYRIIGDDKLEETYQVVNDAEQCWEVLTTGNGAFVALNKPLTPGLLDYPLPDALRPYVTAYEQAINNPGPAASNKPSAG